MGIESFSGPPDHRMQSEPYMPPMLSAAQNPTGSANGLNSIADTISGVRQTTNPIVQLGYNPVAGPLNVLAAPGTANLARDPARSNELQDILTMFIEALEPPDHAATYRPEDNLDGLLDPEEDDGNADDDSDNESDDDADDETQENSET